MKYMILAAISLFIATGQVFAETPDELKAQLKAIDEQIRSEQSKRRDTEQFRQASKTVIDAEMALNNAAKEIPEVKEIDSEVDALNKKLVELTRKRNDAISKNAALADKKKTVEEARKTMQDAMGQNVVRDLFAKRTELNLKLFQATRDTQAAQH